MKNPFTKKPAAKENESRVYDVSEITEIFGKYQIVQYFFACLPSMIVTMVNINYVFVAGDMDYRCKVPECEDLGSTSRLPTWWPNATISRCHKPVIDLMAKNSELYNNTICSKSSFSSHIEECTEWIYESNNTIVGELNLACQPWKTNLVGTIHNVGMLVSMLLSGWMSDRFGRKPTVIICGVSCVIGQLKTFATSYSMYVLIECAEAMISGGIYPATSVMLIEIGGKNNRVLAGVLFAYLIYVGELIFAGIAMAVPHWKTLIRIIYTPPIIFLSYIFILNESIRWQILNGKTKQAKTTIETIASMNKININTQELRDLDDVKLKLKFKIDKYEVREGYAAIFTSKEVLKRLLVASFCRFACGFVYYGLMINSVLLPGNKYSNFLLSTLMSFPGEMIALYFMNKIGRKLPLIVGYLLCGVMCVASAYASATWIKIVLFLIGKMIISACFTGIITYTMELYPTSTRGSLLGIGSFTSRIGAMLAPLTPMLTPISPTLPTIFFGTSAVIAGCLLTLTPETKDQPLMDTIDQVEAIAKSQKDDKKGNIINCETVTTHM